MSDPFKPSSEGEERPEQEPSEKNEKAASRPQEKAKDLKAHQEIKKEAASAHDSGLSKIDLQFSTSKSMTSFGFPLGQTQPFVLKKSEFLKVDHDKPQHELKNLISNFLNDTKLPDEHKLSVAELKELHSNRDRLSSAESVPEAVKTALQLKRMYQEMKNLEAEIKARDLILGLDPNNQFGKQMFKELERMHPQDLAFAPGSVAVPQNIGLSKSRLRARINALSGGRV
ncbi:MAG: hypothetical protein K2X27_17630, partial [Candidatus Obscuribacterales bacterium]|nr:hypothetical protein [Candidatus Obscuribacterales bacterium]